MKNETIKFIDLFAGLGGIRLGFEHGLTMDQVKIYADPKFDDDQMIRIRKDFEDGLTIEEIKNKYSLASRKNKLNKIARRLTANLVDTF